MQKLGYIFAVGEKVGSLFCQGRLYCLKVTPTRATLLLKILPSHTIFCTGWILIMNSYETAEEQQSKENISGDVIASRQGAVC